MAILKKKKMKAVELTGITNKMLRVFHWTEI